MPDTRTHDQRFIDKLRREVDLDWAPRAGCQPATLAMCCEKCVYGTGEHRADCRRKRFIKYFDVNDMEEKVRELPEGYVPAGTAIYLEQDGRLIQKMEVVECP